MRILITGANGFLGKIITSTLTGNEIYTLGRNAPMNYVFDLAKEIPLLDKKFDVVVHAAGKAHTMVSNKSLPAEFFHVNYQGTLNLLQGLKKEPPNSFVLISTVAVYGRESGNLITEDAPLLAKDPYGKSKVMAETAVSEWCQKYNVKCTILRLPLIAGPNPPGNLHAMIYGIQNGKYANVGGGKARRSIVLASDVAEIIIDAAQIGGIYNLTDGQNPSFHELSMLIATQLNKRKVMNIPFWSAFFLALAGNYLGNKLPLNSEKLKKITLDLTFDDRKARTLLNWNPTPVLNGFKIR